MRLAALIFILSIGLATNLALASQKRKPLSEAVCEALLERGGSGIDYFRLSFLGLLYRGEERGASNHHALNKFVRYFDETERRNLVLSFTDGLATRADGYALAGRCLDYVEDREGVVYLLESRFDHHHSSPVAGAPVAAAGAMCFDRTGGIEVLSRKSGHYQPTARQFERFKAKLRAMGADLSRTRYMDFHF